ncbi:DUF460 domain-containing protein [Methanonatronarchaeum sp. AMET-Sl]|uniref:DUF460 domain-containing protein n=1 Tax=Methanonatronarchaeum sp. AMET-Sl TaxID=3037654 RepID=UPI00244E3D14|nr:DUF460 domain-containing protein [Methanonatronarchaeum sp. AMET-Sl]WGI16888.1 DUF460 domain-containing protein [Methanonatronarchaeum sp. AMET-Sl]
MVLGWVVVVRRKYLFVGVDPGTTTGIGVLDLDGELVEVCSARDLSFNDVVEFVVDLGNVVVVATDVSPAPDFVEQLSTVLDAVLWVPDSSLKQEVKRDLVREYSCSDKHQVDALAAAIKAYKTMKSKLQRVESNIPSDINERKAKRLVLKGNSLREAIDELREPKQEDKREKEQEFDPEVNQRIRGLEKKVRELQETCRKLRREKENKEKEITELKSELARIKSKRFLHAITSREVEDKKEKINSLERELKEEKQRVQWLKNKLQDAEEIDEVRNKENITVMKKLPSFTMKKIKELEQGIGINKGDIIYIKDPSGGGSTNAERLSKVKAIAHKGKLSHPAKQKFQEKETPIIKTNQIKDHGNYVTAPKKHINQKIQKAKKQIQQQKKKQLESLKEKYGHDKDIEL